MTDTSPRFPLPFILPGQAQKEAYHNEALTLIDAALHAQIEAAPLDEVPDEPEPGQCWIVGAGAAGAWAGKADSLACWTAGGWRFVSPRPGMLAWNIDPGCWLYWTGSAWSAGRMARDGARHRRPAGRRSAPSGRAKSFRWNDYRCRSAGRGGRAHCDIKVTWPDRMTKALFPCNRRR